MADIKLVYGAMEDGRYAHISEVPRGKTSLGCPFCGGRLVAKKGKKTRHHFAHESDTCFESSSNDLSNIKIPFFSTFGMEKLTDNEAYAVRKIHGCFKYGGFVLQGKHGSAKQALWEAGVGSLWDTLENIQSAGFVEPAADELHRLSHMARISLGHLPLKEFFAFQKKAVAEYRERGVQGTEARVLENLQERVISAGLYLLEVSHPQYRSFLKIGITKRPIDDRIKEVEKDVSAILGQGAKARALRVVPNAGALEAYALYAFRKNSLELGSHREYFVDSQWIRTQFDILSKSESVKQGMAKAEAQGTKIGRPKIKESESRFLNKPKSLLVISLANEGHSLRQLAKKARCSVNTVRKVLELTGKQKPQKTIP